MTAISSVRSQKVVFTKVLEMAVDVMHLNPGQAFAKMAFGKSRSTEELSREHAYPSVVSPSPTSPTSTHSLIDLSLNSSEQEAVERLQASRSQLQKEIEVGVCASVPRSSFACSAIAGYGGVILQAGCKTRVQAKLGSSWLPVQCDR